MNRRGIEIPYELTAEGEAAYYRGLTFRERAELLSAVCSAGADLLRANVDPERAANWVDPLPESSVRAFARLRAEHLAKRKRAEAAP